MKNKTICTFALLLIFARPCFAEKIPIKITPDEIISTNHDEVEIGDWIEFQSVDDVYMNDKLYIAKTTPIIAVVDFVHPNGWGGDNATINLKTFKTINTDNQKIEINFPITIKTTSEQANTLNKKITYYILRVIRGSEIFIEPDTKAFNIFITQ